MRFHFIAAASTLIGTAALAAPAGVKHFDRDGERYEYVASRNADGSINLNGRVVGTGASFALRAQGGKVVGTMDDKFVNFDVSEAAMTALDAETSATSIASN